VGRSRSYSNPLDVRKRLIRVGEHEVVILMVILLTISPLPKRKHTCPSFVADVETEHRRVVITKHGRPSAVVLAVDDLEALEETLDLLSDPGAMADLRDTAGARQAGESIALSKEEALDRWSVGDYQLRWSPPAVRQLDRLSATSPPVIGAIVEFCFGRLIANPQRLGHAVGCSARRSDRSE
jgi:antitoxin YefM